MDWRVQTGTLHPHDQIYAYPFIPPEAAQELYHQRLHFQHHGRGLLEDFIRRELTEQIRIIYAGVHVAALVQVCARYPYEVWSDGLLHAGAGNLTKRSAVYVTVGQPALVKTNIDVPLLPAGRQVLAFMPDRLLVSESSAVGAVSNRDVNVEQRDQPSNSALEPTART